jgi:hypothetical protein
MSIGFFIVGGIIFAVYMYFTIWNIMYSSKKSKQENYSNIEKEKENNLEKIPENIFAKSRNAENAA